MNWNDLAWGTVPDWVGAILTAVTIALTAYGGLRAWRAQMHGRYEIELARKLLLKTYELNDAIEIVRNPWGSGNPEEDYSRRWNALTSVAKELRASLQEARADWGEKKAQTLRKDLDLHLNELYLAIENLLIDRKRKPTTAEDELFTRDQANILYAGRGADGDSYKKKTKVLVKKLEDYARPHLKK